MTIDTGQVEGSPVHIITVHAIISKQENMLHFGYVAHAGSFVDLSKVLLSDVVPGPVVLGPLSHWRKSPAAALANSLKARKHPSVLLSVRRDGLLETDSRRPEVIFLICPKEEGIGALLDRSVAVTGEVALASELGPGACCPTLLAQLLVRALQRSPAYCQGRRVAAQAMPVLVQRQPAWGGSPHSGVSPQRAAGSCGRPQASQPGRAGQAAAAVACWQPRWQGVGGGTGRVSAAPGAR